MLQLANLDSDIRQWTIEQAGPLARERRVTVTAQIDSRSVTTVEDHLKMLFQNLLTNAIIYSHSDRTVRIGCRRIDSHILAWVCDQGIGVPDDLDNECRPANTFLEKPVALEVLRDTVGQLLTAQPSAWNNANENPISGLRPEGPVADTAMVPGR